MSLNNRIYFRDHPFSGSQSTRCYVDSGRSCSSAISSLTFAHPNLHRHTASIGDGLRLGTIPSTKVIEVGKGIVIEDPRCVLPSRGSREAVQRLLISVIHDDHAASSRSSNLNHSTRNQRLMWATIFWGASTRHLTVVVMCLAGSCGKR